MEPKQAPYPRTGRQWPVPPRQMAGVTLIELMIVVVVIAILGMIAVPSYRQHVIRSQRTEAKAALLQIQTNQERFYLQNNTYSADPTQLGFESTTTDGGAYTLSITPAAGGLVQGYIATAVPVAGGKVADDTECTQFELHSDGQRLATPDPQNRCW